MNLAVVFARRYLFGKKSRNAINVISGLSVFVVAFVTAALFILLSAINGLHDLVDNQFTSFDPDLKIEPIKGKVFTPDSIIDILKKTEGVKSYSEVLEEDVLLKYGERQHVSRIKGVSENYISARGFDTLVYTGTAELKQYNQHSCIVGQGVAYFLNIKPSFATALRVYVPKRKGGVSVAPTNLYKSKTLLTAGIFAAHQDVDEKYIITDLEFAKNILDYNNEISALELEVTQESQIDNIKEALISQIGKNFTVHNRNEQHVAMYKILKIEKLGIIVICLFVLIIASFNIVASLTMLIFEKKNDIAVLNSLGADNTMIKRIFTFEGWLISIIGGIAGISLGAIICYLQMEYSLVQVYGQGNYVVMAYPVSMKLIDIPIILGLVIGIGYITAYFPVRYLTKNILTLNTKIA